MNYSPTIRWDYKKFKKIIRSTTNIKVDVLQFAYADVLFDFCKFCNFSLVPSCTFWPLDVKWAILGGKTLYDMKIK